MLYNTNHYYHYYYPQAALSEAGGSGLSSAGSFGSGSPAYSGVSGSDSRASSPAHTDDDDDVSERLGGTKLHESKCSGLAVSAMFFGFVFFFSFLTSGFFRRSGFLKFQKS